MSYKGKSVLVCLTLTHTDWYSLYAASFNFIFLHCPDWLLLFYVTIPPMIDSLIVEFIPLTRAWRLCPTLMRLILPQLMSFS
jgi:hypothetical protein